MAACAAIYFAKFGPELFGTVKFFIYNDDSHCKF